MMQKKLLLIDSDRTLTQQLVPYFEQEHFHVVCVHDGEIGLKKALNQSFDIIILEIMLPKCNGFEILQSLRQHKDTPAIILTARQDEIDRLVGFQVGADDVLNKPCSTHELLARIHAMIRRAGTVKKQKKQTIQQESIVLDRAKRTATRNGLLLELTNTEFTLLETLMQSSGQAFSKEELTEYVLGRKHTPYDRSIDVHVSNLRNKLGTTPKGQEYIKTVRGFGYVFNKKD